MDNDPVFLIRDSLSEITALLAVIEVDHSQRVRCQAPGCGRAVYRRVHVVQLDGRAQVMGEDCCSRIFGWSAKTRPQPRVPVAEGRRLTEAERNQLIENTEALLAQLQQEHERDRLAALAKLQALKSRFAAAAAPASATRAPGLYRPQVARPTPRFSFAQRPDRKPPNPDVMAEALRRMEDKWQLSAQQAQSPGWASLLRDVIAQVEKDRDEGRL